MHDFIFQPSYEQVRPDYIIHKYTDEIYKVVYFKRTCPGIRPTVRTKETKYENKLVQSLSRSRRVVLELALCNDWAYFCTFTLDPKKYQRDDLPKFREDFSQFIRDMRKKYRKFGFDKPIDFVFVPEEHKDGAWHMHGLLSDISPFLISFSDMLMQGKSVPDKLVQGGYLNWPDYQKKFGFCSLGSIRNRIATSFYISKYISKQMDDCKLPPNAHAYYASHGLNHATLHGDIYGYCPALDKYLTHDYEFCRTGMTHVKDGLTWDFAFQYMDHLIEPLDLSAYTEIEAEVDQYVQFTQSAIDGFSEVTYG